MSRFKYKVWDLKEAKFVTDSRDLIMGEKPYLQGYDYSEGDETISEILLYQSCDLVDKNGKEIYEGDIIRIGGGNRIEIMDNIKQMGIWEYELGLDGDDMEVIGNILENPELIPDPDKYPKLCTVNACQTHKAKK